MRSGREADEYRTKDLNPGERYGRLTVIRALGRIGRYWRWSCLCDCGETYAARSSALVSGNTASCGCLKREYVVAKNIARKIHGHASGGKVSPTYSSFRSMMARCYDQSHMHYKNYGGRGISVHSSLATFNDFLRYVEPTIGLRPLGKTLSRINNDGNYEPGNIEWATPLAQTHNRRCSKVKKELHHGTTASH